MKDEGKHIEDLFRETFESSSAVPPEHVWDTIDHSLQNSHVDALYSDTFKNAHISPSKSVWKRISAVLLIQNFFTFNYQTINAYYVLFTALVGGVGLYLASPEHTTPSITLVEDTVEHVITASPETHIPQTKTNKEIAENKNSTEQNTAEPLVSTEKLKPEIQRTPTTSSEQEEEKIELQLENMYVEGRSQVCEGSTVQYSLLGIPKEYTVSWNTENKDISVQEKSNKNITAQWDTPGNYTIQATISYKNASAMVTYPVTVEKLIKPEVEGDKRVCVGEEKMLYKINEPVNKDIRYIWESEHNHIHMIGNKYVNIDWNKAGKDTLRVTRIDDKTGCKSQGNFVVDVRPKPNVSFTYEPMGNDMFNFTFTGDDQQSIRKYEWNIEGATYTHKNVKHYSNSSNSSIVTLKVTDKNKCTHTYEKEIPFNKYIMFIPQRISIHEHSFSEEGFLPQTNTPLSSYKIEIFNEHNEKIWESSQLEDGKPAEAWDGTYRNNPVPSGKYFWKISAVFKDGVTWNGIRKSNGTCKPEGIVYITQE
ncbi:MAG: gliding motility-associated C-terminal domain-containing protein [Bacteroidales bacterium]